MTNAWQQLFPHPEHHWDGIIATFLVTTEWTFLAGISLLLGSVLLSLWLEVTAKTQGVVQLRIARRWYEHLFMNKWIAYGLTFTSLVTVGLMRSAWVAHEQPVVVAVYAFAALFVILGISLHNSYGYYLMVKDLEEEHHVSEKLNRGSAYNGYWAATCYAIGLFLYAGALSWGSDQHQWNHGQFDGYFSYWGLWATWTLALLLVLISVPLAALSAWFFAKPIESEDTPEFEARSMELARLAARWTIPGIPVALLLWYISLPGNTVNWTTSFAVLVAIAISYGMFHLTYLKNEIGRYTSIFAAGIFLIPLAVAFFTNSQSGLREMRAEQVKASIEAEHHPKSHGDHSKDKEDQSKEKATSSHGGLQLHHFEME